MPEVSLATENQLINELVSREAFVGAVVVAALAANGGVDSAVSYFSENLNDQPTWRRRAPLERAEQHIGTPPALS